MECDCFDNWKRQPPQTQQIRSDLRVSDSQKFSLNFMLRTARRAAGLNHSPELRGDANGKDKISNIVKQSCGVLRFLWSPKKLSCHSCGDKSVFLLSFDENPERRARGSRVEKT
jgi:hypothetical protein